MYANMCPASRPIRICLEARRRKSAPSKLRSKSSAGRASSMLISPRPVMSQYAHEINLPFRAHDGHATTLPDIGPHAALVGKWEILRRHQRPRTHAGGVLDIVATVRNRMSKYWPACGRIVAPATSGTTARRRRKAASSILGWRRSSRVSRGENHGAYSSCGSIAAVLSANRGQWPKRAGIARHRAKCNHVRMNDRARPAAAAAAIDENPHRQKLVPSRAAALMKEWRRREYRRNRADGIHPASCAQVWRQQAFHGGALRRNRSAFIVTKASAANRQWRNRGKRPGEKLSSASCRQAWRRPQSDYAAARRISVSSIRHGIMSSS